MNTGSQELGELLSELKARSGRSYQVIGRKVYTSKSTVQRYCTGSCVPREFAVIERIAQVCGATADEIARLSRLWAEATSPAAATSTPTTATERIDPGAPARWPQAARRRWRLGAALATTGLAVLIVLAISAGAPSHRPPQPRPAWITGPAWTRPAAPVPRTLFGVTINSSTGAMPGFRVGAVRLWDSDTRWADLQPKRGTFDWSVLDREVAGAQRARLPVLFVLGGTPGWASPAGPVGPYPDGARAAPPDHLSDWDMFVRALVGRYHGRIDAYELWVLANDRHFYTGSIDTLIDMTRRASQIIRAADPKATLVCPGMGNLWTLDGQRVLERFAQGGGYQYCDVAGIKLYQPSASDPPETMLQLAATTDRLFHRAGIHPRLWSTGTTYSIPLQNPLDESTARNYAVRFYLVGIYARDLNLERMYFYNWGGTRIPLVLQAEGGTPTRAALAIDQLQMWLAHAQSRSCGHGSAINLPDNVWQCQFTITQAHRSYDATICWTSTGTAAIAAARTVASIHRLDGTTAAVRPGGIITLTQEPILIQHRTELPSNAIRRTGPPGGQPSKPPAD